MSGGVRDLVVTAVSRLLSAWRPPAEGPPALPRTARVLVIKPCCLGDLLLATPAIAALRKALPHAHLTLATSQWARPAIEGNPDVDAIVAVPPVVRPFHLPGLAVRLRRGHYDVAVVLDRSPVATLLPWLAGIPVRAGLDAQGRGFSLTHPVSTDPLRHEAALYLDAVRAIIPGAGNPGLRFLPGAGDHDWAEEQLPEGRWVAVHAGGGVNPGSELTGKRWPLERFQSIVGRLIRAGNRVVLVGSPDDEAAASQISAGAGQGVLDLTGKTSFSQLGAVLSRCVLFIGNDTGPMHLAVAVGVPVVAVFGPSSPVAYGPWSGRSRVIYHAERCEGCRFRGGLVASCRNGYACTAAATEEEVWAAVRDLLP
jgi:lipopolysaccharide heptosyltransferase II